MSDSDSDDGLLDSDSTLDLPTDDDTEEPSPKAKPKPKPKSKGEDTDSEPVGLSDSEEEGEEEDEETEEEEESVEEVTDSDASSEAASLESTASDSPKEKPPPKKKPEPKADKAEKEKKPAEAAPASPPAEPKVKEPEAKPKPKPKADPPKKAEEAPKPKEEKPKPPPPEKKREARSPPASARQPARSPRPQSASPRPQTARRSTPSPRPASPSPTFGGGSTKSVRRLPKDSHLNAPTSAYRARLEEAKNTRKTLSSQTSSLKKARPQEQGGHVPTKVPNFKYVLGKRVSEMKAAPSAAFTTATPRFAWATSGEKTPAPGEFFHPKKPERQTTFPQTDGRGKRVAGFGSTLERDTVYSISNGQLFSTRRRSKKKPEEVVETMQCPYSSFASIKRGKAMKEEKGSAWAKSRTQRGETASPIPNSGKLDRVQRTRLKAKQAEMAKEKELRSKVGARDPTETSQQEWVQKARESVVRKGSEPPTKKGQKRVGFGASSSRDCLHYGKVSQSPAPGSYIDL